MLPAAYRTTVPTMAANLAGPRAAVPDFAAIVANHGPCDTPGTCASKDCARARGWTPRNAALLHAAAMMAYNDFVVDTGLLENLLPVDLSAVIDQLPPVVAALADPTWVARFIGCFADLGMRIEDGALPVPRCTAEQVALHFMASDARDRVAHLGVPGTAEGGWLHVFAETEAALPACGHDYDFDALEALLVTDRAFLALFNPELDGIDPDQAARERLGLTWLHPAHWFTAFNADRPVPALAAGAAR